VGIRFREGQGRLHLQHILPLPVHLEIGEEKAGGMDKTKRLKGDRKKGARHEEGIQRG
jgi:hypothetical protein